MATSIYLRNQFWGSGNEHGKWQSGTNDTHLDGTALGWAVQRWHTTRGSSASTITRTTSVGPTNGQEIAQTTCWISAPLAADVTISGSITFNLRMSESAGTVNGGAQVVIEKVNSIGALSTIVNSEKGTELGTVETAENWSATPTSTNMSKGDRLRLRVLVNDAGGTLTAGGTITLWMDGTAGATGDSYVSFTESLTFATGFPTPVTTVYLTDTASDIDPGGGSVDTKEAWTSRGAGTATCVANTTAGWTSPIQWTKTAGGNTVEWYTKQLQAFTLGGVVKVVMHGLESNVAANISPRAELAICDSAGAVLSTWGSTAVNNELGTVDAETIWNIAGDDTAVADSNRLRIRFAMDDTQDAAMGAAFTGTLGYAGAVSTGGDTYLVFAETLSEYSAAAPKTKTRRVSFTQAASQQASRW